MTRLRLLLSCYFVVALGTGLRDVAHAANDLPVYADGLGSAWENWSWASVDFASTTAVHSGTTSIAVTAAPFTALWLRHVAFDDTDYGNVSFWINGGPVGGQRLHVAATLADAGQSVGFDIPPLAPSTWQQVTIPLSALGAVAATNFTGFWIQEWAGNTQPVFYVDDVVLTRAVPIIPPPPLDHGMALYDDRVRRGLAELELGQRRSGQRPSGEHRHQLDRGAGRPVHRASRFTTPRWTRSNYASLTFWINGGSQRRPDPDPARACLSGIAQPGFTLPPLTADPTTPGTRSPCRSAALGVAGKPDLTDFWMQETGRRRSDGEPVLHRRRAARSRAPAHPGPGHRGRQASGCGPSIRGCSASTPTSGTARSTPAPRRTCCSRPTTRRCGSAAARCPTPTTGRPT